MFHCCFLLPLNIECLSLVIGQCLKKSTITHRFKIAPPKIPNYKELIKSTSYGRSGGHHFNQVTKMNVISNETSQNSGNGNKM